MELVLWEGGGRGGKRGMEETSERGGIIKRFWKGRVLKRGVEGVIDSKISRNEMGHLQSSDASDLSVI